MKRNWKLWLVGAGLVLAVAFVVTRVYRASVVKPPDWIRQHKRGTPSLGRDSEVQRSWDHLQVLREQVQMQMAKLQLPLGSLQLVMVRRDSKEVIRWTAQPLINPGFQPMSNFECGVPVDASRFVGYYSEDGKPLDYTVKQDPAIHPGQFITTIHLPAPVPPGTTALVFQVTRPAKQVEARDGQFEVLLGRLPSPTAAIHARAVVLPEQLEVKRYLPVSGPRVFADDGVMIVWVNTLLDPPDAPASLSFQAVKR